MFFGGAENVYMFDPNVPDTITTYSKKDGIDTTTENYVFTYNKDVFVAGQGGILQFYENAKPNFVKESKFNIFKGNPQMLKATQVENNIWLALQNISTSMTSIDGDGLCILALMMG